MKKKTLIWLDDNRDINKYRDKYSVFFPIQDKYTYIKVIWLKNYTSFVEWITLNGLPDAICFDHDLGDTDGKSGMDCARWLVEYCLDNGIKKLPLYNIQSANPVGKENILSLLQGYQKFVKSNPFI